MAEFFKTLLKGVIYVVLLPFILLALALAFLYCLLLFIYLAIKNVIIFFAGGNPLGDLKEDKEAKKILAARAAAPSPAAVQPNSIYVQQVPPQFVYPNQTVATPVSDPNTQDEEKEEKVDAFDDAQTY